MNPSSYKTAFKCTENRLFMSKDEKKTRITSICKSWGFVGLLWDFLGKKINS